MKTITLEANVSSWSGSNRCSPICAIDILRVLRPERGSRGRWYEFAQPFCARLPLRHCSVLGLDLYRCDMIQTWSFVWLPTVYPAGCTDGVPRACPPPAPQEREPTGDTDSALSRSKSSHILCERAPCRRGSIFATGIQRFVIGSRTEPHSIGPCCRHRQAHEFVSMNNV